MPDYERERGHLSLPQRKSSPVLIAACVVIPLIGGFWMGVGYIVWHFLAKFW